jgi:hypothetical protein
MSNKETKSPITVEGVVNAHLSEKINLLFSNIIVTKNKLVTDKLKNKLDLRDSQFETILRKESKRIASAILAGDPYTIIKERFFFDRKYLFTIIIDYNPMNKITDNIDLNFNIMELSIKFRTIEEENIPDLKEIVEANE